MGENPILDMGGDGSQAPSPTAEAGSEAASTVIEGLAAAAESPAGSIAAFLPAPSGRGIDYAGQAARQALLAALNGRGGIPSRWGG